MSTPKIFVTGATGYIGGDALHLLTTTHPNYQITALVRNSDKGAKVAAAYPSIRFVYGDLDSTDLIETESAAADIVLHCANADHAGSAAAIVKGLSQHSADRPGYYIHTSGTGILQVLDAQQNRYGQDTGKVYDDWDGIGEVTSLPDDAVHRDVDKIVLAAAADPVLSQQVKTAIVCPPCIYGPGRGPDNRRSVQAYEMTRVTLERGHGVRVLDGKNRWCQVHVQDLAKVFVRLVEEAAAALAGASSKATWGMDGYYFAENGEFVWGEVAAAIAREAKKQGLVASDEVTPLTPDEADKATPFGAYMWGMNSRSRAIRARKLLGWEPTERGLFEEIPDIVRSEASRAGKVKGHAEVAAGNA